MSAEPLLTLEEEESSEDDSIAYMFPAFIWPGMQAQHNTYTFSGGQHAKQPNVHRDFDRAMTG